MRIANLAKWFPGLGVVGEKAPPEPHRFAPADEEVIKGVVERIGGALLQEIQDMNAGNPALAMISLPPVSAPVRQPAGA